ncbi:MAG: hypothetical protein QXF56_04450 [Candidatus Micrarchaeia archaeon]
MRTKDKSDIKSSNEINVQKIMEKIRANIRKRRGAESSEYHTELTDLSDVEKELELMRAELDIENRSYHISSHRKLLGPILTSGRSLVHGEVRRYVDPVFSKQKKFNIRVLGVLTLLSKEIYKMKKYVHTSIRKTRRR